MFDYFINITQELSKDKIHDELVAFFDRNRIYQTKLEITDFSTNSTTTTTCGKERIIGHDSQKQFEEFLDEFDSQILDYVTKNPNYRLRELKFNRYLILNLSNTKKIMNIVQKLVNNKTEPLKQLTFHECKISNKVLQFILSMCHKINIDNDYTVNSENDNDEKKVGFRLVNCSWTTQQDIPPLLTITSRWNFPFDADELHLRVSGVWLDDSLNDIENLFQDIKSMSEGGLNINIDEIQFRKATMSIEAIKYVLKLCPLSYENDNTKFPFLQKFPKKILRLSECKVQIDKEQILQGYFSIDYDKKLRFYGCRIMSSKEALLFSQAICQLAPLVLFSDVVLKVRFCHCKILMSSLDIILSTQQMIKLSTNNDGTNKKFMLSCEFSDCSFRNDITNKKYPFKGYLSFSTTNKACIKVTSPDDCCLPTIAQLISSLSTFKSVIKLHVNCLYILDCKYGALPCIRKLLQSTDTNLQYLSLKGGKFDICGLRLLIESLQINKTLKILDIVMDKKEIVVSSFSLSKYVKEVFLNSVLELFEKYNNKTLEKLYFDRVFFYQKRDISMIERMDFYLGLNRLKLTFCFLDDILPVFLVAVILSKANDNPSIIFWVLQQYPYIVMHHLSGQNRKKKINER